MHILILDDEPTVTQAIGFALVSLGHSIQECYRPEIALLKIQAESFDLIFCDYRLGKTSGLDLVCDLRKINCVTPVILITGYASDIDRARAKLLGIDTILHKPFSILEIEHAIEKYPISSGQPGHQSLN